MIKTNKHRIKHLQDSILFIILLYNSNFRGIQFYSNVNDLCPLLKGNSDIEDSRARSKSNLNINITHLLKSTLFN